LVIFGMDIFIKKVCEVPIVVGEVLIGLSLGQLAIMVGAILPERGAIRIFTAHSSSPGAHWPSSAWISRIRSPTAARSSNMLGGVERGRGATQRGTQVNSRVRNSLHRPPHQRQISRRNAVVQPFKRLPAVSPPREPTLLHRD
jgi:hypothetical protein